MQPWPRRYKASFWVLVGALWALPTLRGWSSDQKIVGTMSASEATRRSPSTSMGMLSNACCHSHRR